MATETQAVNRLDGAVTALVVITTIVGALIAWRANLTSTRAGSADNAGLSSLTWAESSKTLHTVDAFEDYRLFLNYKSSDQLGDIIEERLPEVEEVDEKAGLERELEEARQLAQINMSFLDETKASRYLTRDGRFSLERQMGEKWAAAAGRQEVDSQPRFDRADRLRKRKKSQLVAGILLTLALFVFTLFRLFKGPLRLAMVGLGITLLLSGSIWAIVLERSV